MLPFSEAAPATDSAKSAAPLGRAEVAAALAIAVLAIILGWSFTERLPVTVIVTPDSVTGRLGASSVQAPRTSHGPVAIGYFLQGNDPTTQVLWQSSPPEDAWPARIGQLVSRIGTESAWGHPSVRLLANGTLGASSTMELSPSFGDWFVHPLGGLAVPRPGLAISSPMAADTFQVDVDLLRPRNAAGIFVGEASGANGLLFYFRPENRDGMWYDIRDGQWYGPVATIPYRAFAKDPGSGVQDVVRLALGGIPAGLVIVNIVGGLGAIERLRRRRVGLPTTSDSGNRDEAQGGRPSIPAGPTIEHLPGLLAACLAVAGLAATLYVATALLERIPHVQDSVAYVFQAKTFALGLLWVPTPLHPQFFTHEFIVMDTAERWFSKYPPGWPMLLALGELIKAPWIVDPICGALSLGVLYRLGTEIFRPRVGLLAAILGLSAPFFLFLSGSFMSHASGLLFTLLMTWCFLRATRSKRPLLPSALTGVAFGILFLIRPFTALPLTVPLAVYALIQITRQPGDGFRRYFPSVVAAIPFVATFLAYNRVFTGNWFYPPQQLWWAFDQVGFAPTMDLGDTPRSTHSTTRAATSPSFSLMVLVGRPFSRSPYSPYPFSSAGASLGLVVPGWIRRSHCGLCLLVGRWDHVWSPLLLRGLGFMILLTARGFDVLLDLGEAQHDALGSIESPSTVASSGVYLLVAALVAFNIAYYLPGQLKLYHGYNYVSSAKIDAVQASGIHRAVVFANAGQSYEWWEYGEVFSANRSAITRRRDLRARPGRCREPEADGRLPGTILLSAGWSNAISAQ